MSSLTWATWGILLFDLDFFVALLSPISNTYRLKAICYPFLFLVEVYLIIWPPKLALHLMLIGVTYKYTSKDDP